MYMKRRFTETEKNRPNVRTKNVCISNYIFGGFYIQTFLYLAYT